MAEKLTIPDYRGLIDAVDASTCPHIECDCKLVYPVSWVEHVGVEGLFGVVLRCPNCENTRSGFMNIAETARYDLLMDVADRDIENDLIDTTDEEFIAKVSEVLNKPSD